MIYLDSPTFDDLIYKKQKKKAYRYAEKQRRKEELYRIKYNKPKAKKSFSKLTTIFLYVNLTIVELFCMAIMWNTMDLSALPTFITCIIGEILVHFISCEKSKKENMVGGIVHDTAMEELRNKLSNATKEQNNIISNNTSNIYDENEAVG